MPADDALARFSVDLHQELLSDAAAQPDGALTADVYTQRMIEHLTERGWTRQQGYVICSVAVDLKISQLVDVPNMLVSAFLPEDIFS